MTMTQRVVTIRTISHVITKSSSIRMDAVGQLLRATTLIWGGAVVLHESSVGS